MLKSLLRKTRNDLRQNWRRFLAVWFVVILGTAFYGAMYPSGLVLLDSIYRTYDQLAYMDFQVRFEGASTRLVEQVRALPGVAAVEGRLVIDSGVQLDPAYDTLTTLRLISLPERRPLTVNRSQIFSGSAIQGPDELLLLKRFADYHGLQPGDTLTVWVNGSAHHLRIAGLVFNPEYLVAGRSPESPFPSPSSFGVAWLPESSLRELSGWRRGEINEVVLRLEGNSAALTPARLEALRGELERLFDEDEEVSIQSRFQTASGGVVDANAKGNFPVMGFFSALFLVGAIVITGVLLGRQVQAELRSIGALRALGVRRSELALHYTLFGLLIGLSGGLVGSVLGYFLSFAVMQPFVDTIAGGFLPGYRNLPQLPFILGGYLAVVLGATLAAASPAWIESGVEPGIALRPPAPKTPSALSRLPLGFLPRPLSQALRSLLRVPGRSLGTALGVLAGSVMVFTSLAMIDSMESSFSSYFASNAYDLRVYSAALSPDRTLARRLEQISGVAQVQPALFGLVAVERPGGGEFSTIAIVVDERQPFFDLQLMQGEPAFSQPDGVWIGNNLQRVLGLQVGDTLRLRALGEQKQAQVRGVVSQAFGSPVFIPRSQFVQWTSGELFPVNLALLRLEPGQMEAVRADLAQIPGLVGSEDYAAYCADINAYLDYWRRTIWMFAMFGGLLTLAVIANTVSANLHEQQTEIAIRRSLGIRPGEIAQAALLELLLVSALGVLVGVPLGRETGFALLHNLDMDFYGLVNTLSPASYIFGVLALLSVALLSALPGLRAAQKIDLGAVSKSQSL